MFLNYILRKSTHSGILTKPIKYLTVSPPPAQGPPQHLQVLVEGCTHLLERCQLTLTADPSMSAHAQLYIRTLSTLFTDSLFLP